MTGVGQYVLQLFPRKLSDSRSYILTDPMSNSYHGRTKITPAWFAAGIAHLRGQFLTPVGSPEARGLIHIDLEQRVIGV